MLNKVNICLIFHPMIPS